MHSIWLEMLPWTYCHFNNYLENHWIGFLIKKTIFVHISYLFLHAVQKIYSVWKCIGVSLSRPACKNFDRTPQSDTASGHTKKRVISYRILRQLFYYLHSKWREKHIKKYILAVMDVVASSSKFYRVLEGDQERESGLVQSGYKQSGPRGKIVFFTRFLSPFGPKLIK